MWLQRTRRKFIDKLMQVAFLDYGLETRILLFGCPVLVVLFISAGPGGFGAPAAVKKAAKNY